MKLTCRLGTTLEDVAGEEGPPRPSRQSAQCSTVPPSELSSQPDQGEPRPDAIRLPLPELHRRIGPHHPPAGRARAGGSERPPSARLHSTIVV